jgi:hypothetical protein
MNAMIRNSARADLIALALSLAVFYALVAIADGNDWSRHAHAAVGAGALAIMVVSRLLLAGADGRRRLRVTWGRRVRAAWRWLRRRSRLQA